MAFVLKCSFVLLNKTTHKVDDYPSSPCQPLLLNPYHSGTLQADTLENSEDPDERLLKGTFHQDLHFSEIQIYYNLEISICDPLKYKNGQLYTYSINTHGKIHQM